MKVGLFIPWYIDQFYPQVSIAALGLLQKFGCGPEHPLQQMCCEQPMANAGCEKHAPARTRIDASGYTVFVAGLSKAADIDAEVSLL